MHARVALRKAAVLKTEISEVYLVQPELFLLVFEVSFYAGVKMNCLFSGKKKKVLKNLALSYPKFFCRNRYNKCFLVNPVSHSFSVK